MGRRIRALVAAGLVAASTVVGLPAAAAKGGEVGGSGAGYYLSDTFSPLANVELSYGGASDDVFVGDWDGDGVDTLAYRRGNTFYVRNTNTTGPHELTFSYGRAGETVLVGDWDGDGVDTLAVRRGNLFHVKNTLVSGVADHVIAYGRVGDTVLVGDWDADAQDTFAVRRGRDYHVRNSMTSGPADKVAAYGRPEDEVYVGDWDGDGEDTFTVRRGSVYYVANAIRAGEADLEVVYGRATDTTLVGDWNGDGVDSLGVRRLEEPAPTGSGSDVVPDDDPVLAGLEEDGKNTGTAPPVVTDEMSRIAASYVPPAPSRGAGLTALAWARTQIGIPYVWAGTGPDGYDCSGLTMRAYERAGVKLPRTTRDQWTATTRVALDDLQPGDLMFWSSNGQPNGIYHVAIYSDVSNGSKMRVHAPSKDKTVEEVPVWSGNLLPYGGRIG
ncbi:C40 family peptidase [Georgenia sp. EYE_87]|uniref:C40 family peptidase n=1 Tax=Georgenia sp. EYE_87 TaxID=2853448 RepID=UPI002005179D|nr:C40 family peptidase [Georgenia sp. EYE_87]MCK6210457.1 C40 family peptidase [Georgenia sp. EYE_87]